MGDSQEGRIHRIVQSLPLEFDNRSTKNGRYCEARSDPKSCSVGLSNSSISGTFGNRTRRDLAGSRRVIDQFPNGNQSAERATSIGRFSQITEGEQRPAILSKATRCRGSNLSHSPRNNVLEESNRRVGSTRLVHVAVSSVRRVARVFLDEIPEKSRVNSIVSKGSFGTFFSQPFRRAARILGIISAF